MGMLGLAAGGTVEVVVDSASKPSQAWKGATALIKTNFSVLTHRQSFVATSPQRHFSIGEGLQGSVGALRGVLALAAGRAGRRAMSEAEAALVLARWWATKAQKHAPGRAGGAGQGPTRLVEQGRVEEEQQLAAAAAAAAASAEAQGAAQEAARRAEEEEEAARARAAAEAAAAETERLRLAFEEEEAARWAEGERAAAEAEAAQRQRADEEAEERRRQEAVEVDARGDGGAASGATGSAGAAPPPAVDAEAVALAEEQVVLLAAPEPEPEVSSGGDALWQASSSPPLEGEELMALPPSEAEMTTTIPGPPVEELASTPEEADEAPPPAPFSGAVTVSQWRKVTDDVGDTYFVNAENPAESVWELPLGGVVIEE